MRVVLLRLALLACAVVACAAAAPAAGVAQDPVAPTGTTGSSWGGAVLGAYSGSVYGLLGTLMPCNRTLAGGKCAASGFVAGAGLGGAMGGIVGSQDRSQVIRRAQGAGWGAAVGGLVGVGLWKGVRQYGWADAAATAAVGGAIGAAPRGAMIGAGIGAAAGAFAWAAFPKAGFADFVLFTLGGVAVGGLYDWVTGATDAGRGEPVPGPVFSIPVGW